VGSRAALPIGAGPARCRAYWILCSLRAGVPTHPPSHTPTHTFTAPPTPPHSLFHTHTHTHTHTALVQGCRSLLENDTSTRRRGRYGSGALATVYSGILLIVGLLCFYIRSLVLLYAIQRPCARARTHTHTHTQTFTDISEQLAAFAHQPGPRWIIHAHRERHGSLLHVNIFTKFTHVCLHLHPSSTCARARARVCVCVCVCQKAAAEDSLRITEALSVHDSKVKHTHSLSFSFSVCLSLSLSISCADATQFCC